MQEVHHLDQIVELELIAQQEPLLVLIEQQGLTVVQVHPHALPVLVVLLAVQEHPHEQIVLQVLTVLEGHHLVPIV